MKRPVPYLGFFPRAAGLFRRFVPNAKAFLAMFAAMLVASCGGDSAPTRPLSGVQFSQIVSNAWKLGQGGIPQLRAPAGDQAVILPWKVHVDISSDLQGFFIQRDAPITKILERLKDKLPPGSKFVGESRSSTNGVESGWMELARPETYVQDRVGYSNLFARITRESAYNHIFITDGVLTQGREILHPSVIWQGLRGFLASGGDCTLLMTRQPFKGNYISAYLLERLPANAEPRDAVIACDTPERPLYVWAFTAPGQSLSRNGDPLGGLSAYIDLKAGENSRFLKFAHLSTEDDSVIDQNPYFVEGLPGAGDWQCLLPPSQLSSRLRLVSTDPVSAKKREAGAPGFAAIDWFTFSHTPAGVKFRFELQTAASLPTQTALDLFSRRHSLRVDAFQLEQNGLTRLPPVTPAIQWSRPPQTNSAKLLLDITVPRPRATKDDMALVFNLFASSPMRVPRTWADLSTDDDSKPEAASRTYKLRPWLEGLYENGFEYATRAYQLEWKR